MTDLEKEKFEKIEKNLEQINTELAALNANMEVFTQAFRDFVEVMRFRL